MFSRNYLHRLPSIPYPRPSMVQKSFVVLPGEFLQLQLCFSWLNFNLINVFSSHPTTSSMVKVFSTILAFCSIASKLFDSSSHTIDSCRSACTASASYGLCCHLSRSITWNNSVCLRGHTSRCWLSSLKVTWSFRTFLKVRNELESFKKAFLLFSILITFESNWHFLISFQAWSGLLFLWWWLSAMMLWPTCLASSSEKRLSSS